MRSIALPSLYLLRRLDIMSTGKKPPHNAPAGSTTPQNAPPLQPPADAAPAKPHINVNVEEAMVRFAPFVFCFDSDTRETVDFKPIFDVLARDSSIAGAYFPIDRAEVANWYAGLTDPAIAPTVAEVKGQLSAIVDGQSWDSHLVAVCIKHKIRSLAIEREEVRMEEVEAVNQRHTELVERLMEEGLTHSEAEKAAREEEAAAALAEEGIEPIAKRPQAAFVHLKGFPLTPEHVLAMKKEGVQLNAVLCVNSKAKFGKREEVVAVDPKAKGAKGKTDAKKPEAKKGSKAKDEGQSIPQESLATLLRNERKKLPKYEAHCLKEILTETYEVASVEVVPTDAAAAAAANAPETQQKVYELQESEADVADRMLNRVIALESLLQKYLTWLAKKRVDTVRGLTLEPAQSDISKRPQTTETAPPNKAAAPLPPQPQKKGGKPAKEEAPQQEAAPPPPPAPVPLPQSMAALPADSELYQRLMDEVSPDNVSCNVLTHCLLEQLSETARGEGSMAATSTVADSIASKNRKDVSDFVDYVLASLDGQEEVVFEAARKRRLKAAQVVEQSQIDSSSAQHAQQSKLLLASNDRIKLMAYSRSKVDGDALLLGIPLSTIENRIASIVNSKATVLATTVKTDHASIATLDEGLKMVRNLLTERCHVSDPEAMALVASRTHAEWLSPKALGERLAEISLFPSTTKSYHVRCADGSGVLVSMQSVPTDRKRWRSTWELYHGHVPFPQWLEWAEHVIKEDLYFNPPPKDDDDEEEEVEPPAEAQPEEEEQEEQEEDLPDDEENDDEETRLKREKIKRMRERKKKAKLEPEYVNFDAIQTEELRRRATLDHLKRRIVPNTEVFYLAANHTASSVYQEESVMFAEDGTTIRTAVSRVNTRGVDCTVGCVGGLAFGFRTTPRSKNPLTEEDAARSGVVAVVSVGSEAIFTIEASVRTGTAPKPTDAPAGPVSTPPPAASTSPHEAVLKPPLPVSTPPAKPATSVHVAVGGLSMEVDPRGYFFFEFPSPRDCSVTIYNPVTQQVQRIFTSELRRWVLSDGTVLSTYSDGTKMNLFPNGNTAVFHKQYWMVTNACGQRVLKHPNGTFTSLVVSLVTTNTDVDTQSKVTTREDGVLSANYDDGRLLVQHVEGTRMWQDSDRRVVEVETEGLPIVCGTPRHAEQSDTILCAKFASGLYITVRPDTRICIGHFHNGFETVVDLKQLLLFVNPSIEKNGVYAVDYAFGGLRGFDSSHAFHVTPFGRTRARPISEEDPAILEDPPTRQVLEVFQAVEVVNEAFAKRLKDTGIDVATALHTVKKVTFPERWDADIVGFAPPPRSRQMKEKERVTATALRQVVPAAQSTLPCYLAPHIFILSPTGSALELLRKEDMVDYAKSSIAHSDLLHSAVYCENVGAKFDETPSESVPPKEPVTKVALTPRTPRDAQPAPEPAPGTVTHMVVSVAPARPQQRPGIPKIISSIRSGSSGVPATVSHFLQELRQGPTHSSSSAAASGDLAEMAVECSARHFLRFTGASQRMEEPSALAAVPMMQLADNDALYNRALEHLAKSIPAVIAAQLSVQRTAAIIAMNRETRSTRGHERSRSEGSRERDSRGFPKKRDPNYDYRKVVADAEFATQMEKLKEAEKKQRKPWPTPIPDLRAKIDVFRQPRSNYWALFGAGVLPSLKTELDKYKTGGTWREEQSVKQQQQQHGPGTVTVEGVSPVLKDAPPQDIVPSPPRDESQRRVVVPKAPVGKSPAPGDSRTSVSMSKRGMGSTSLKRPLVAVPPQVDFGSVLDGFRYAITVTLTNASPVAARFRIAAAPQCRSFLSVKYPKMPIAAGMSCRVSVELRGTQPQGAQEGELLVTSEVGSFVIPVKVMSSASQDPLQTTHARLLGPVESPYVPNHEPAGDMPKDEEEGAETDSDG